MMKKMGFMFLAIGLFAAYGAYNLKTTKKFNYRNTQFTGTANSDPETYQGTVNIAMILSVVGIGGGLIMIMKGKS